MVMAIFSCNALVLEQSRSNGMLSERSSLFFSLFRLFTIQPQCYLESSSSRQQAGIYWRRPNAILILDTILTFRSLLHREYTTVLTHSTPVRCLGPQSFFIDIVHLVLCFSSGRRSSSTICICRIKHAAGDIRLSAIRDVEGHGKV